MRRRVQRGDYHPDFRQPVSFHRQVRSYLSAAGPNWIRTPDKEEAAQVKAASNCASVSLSARHTSTLQPHTQLFCDFLHIEEHREQEQAPRLRLWMF